MFSDFFHVSVTTRIRGIFFFYTIISIGSFILYWVRSNVYLDWKPVYLILFAISALSSIGATIRPKIGNGSLHLLPLWAAMVLYVVDLWKDYFIDDEFITLNMVLAGSIVPVFVIVSIVYIDLLESRIYHRLVETLGKKT